MVVGLQLGGWVCHPAPRAANEVRPVRWGLSACCGHFTVLPGVTTWNPPLWRFALENARGCVYTTLP